MESQLPSGPPAGHIVLVHGLEGSGRAGYIRSLAGAALLAGYAAHRFHMRSCGGTEAHSKTLYHGGMTGDLKAVLGEFRKQGMSGVFPVGFSLGGNVVVKLAAELGESARELLEGVVAISGALDLAACSERLALMENRLYERRFVRRMKRRLLGHGAVQTGGVHRDRDHPRVRRSDYGPIFRIRHGGQLLPQPVFHPLARGAAGAGPADSGG